MTLPATTPGDELWFTVFTGTYNRAQTLRRVYDSLLAQTMRSFEWLIVDDGSTDGTEALVKDMIEEGRLNIRYIKKPNGGIHTAHNRAIEEANGRFFLRLDSDDACVPETLDILLQKWQEIPQDFHDQYSGVSCLCMRPSGAIVGDPYPSDGWDSDYATLQALRGEKWGVHRLEVLRKYPFPLFVGERFCPEGLIWARLHDEYKTRCFNIPLRIYFDSSDSITSKIVRTRYLSPKGAAIYYSEQMCRAGGIRAFRHAINYVRFSLPSDGMCRAMYYSKCKGMTLLALPFGWMLNARDRLLGDCT